MGLGPQHVLWAQGRTRTSSAKKLKASFKEKPQCQQSFTTLASAQGSSKALFIISLNAKKSKEDG